MKNKLFLLDAYALIFRAYYAFISRPITNSKGLNTSAIYGFVNTLLEILNNEKPSHIAVVFDPPDGNFRNEIYPEYKANRDETPEDIKLAVPYIKKILKYFNIQVIEVPNYEADDVIGTLSLQGRDHDFMTFMMTPDKDYMQLVTDNVIMYKPGRGGKKAEIMGIEEVKTRYKIQDPAQVIDILALMGDSSDNIPGAPGVGEKTAQKLIEKFGSVDDLIANVHQLKGKQKENIENNIDQILLSKRLVTINRQVPVDVDFSKLALSEVDFDSLVQLFEELEFRTLIDRIRALYHPAVRDQKADHQQTSLFENLPATDTKGVSNLTSFDDIQKEYILIDHYDGVVELCDKLLKHSLICFDTETTSLVSVNAELVGISFSVEKNKAWYIAFPEDRDLQLQWLQPLKQIFENPDIEKVGHNLKYDIQILMNYKIDIYGNLFDTMVAHYLIQPESKHGLDFLAENYLNYRTVHIEELIGEKGKNQLNIRSVNKEVVKDYACEDADVSLQLMEIFRPELERYEMIELAEKIEMPLVRVLAGIEYGGVDLNFHSLSEYKNVLMSKIEKLQGRIYEHAGEKFNIASPRQLGIILFEKLKIIDNPKKTRTKQYSTSEETLQKLKDKHSIIEDILDYRGLSKLLSTYVEALPKLINPTTKKIHTSFNQTITSTGRLSSNNPNLQNIPIREEEGKLIRKAFIPSRNDHVLVAADYSQVELRLMAHMSGDKNMIEAFNAKQDIHTATASGIYKVPVQEVTRDQRSRAKTANFGIIYGISAFGLSQRLDVPRSEAKALIDGYFKAFPDVSKYMNEVILKAKQAGYVKTICGRRRYLPNINSQNAMVRGIDERNAINAPIQGSAADIIKMAMIEIFDEITYRKLMSRMTLQVHDELVFDCPASEVDELKSLIHEKMENVVKLSVPLTVDIGVGKNWLEAH